jgi:hypothetical protein
MKPFAGWEQSWKFYLQVFDIISISRGADVPNSLHLPTFTAALTQSPLLTTYLMQQNYLMP